MTTSLHRYSRPMHLVERRISSHLTQEYHRQQPSRSLAVHHHMQPSRPAPKQRVLRPGHGRRSLQLRAGSSWSIRQRKLLKDGEDFFRQAELLLDKGNVKDADVVLKAARSRMRQCGDCGIDMASAAEPVDVLPVNHGKVVRKVLEGLVYAVLAATAFAVALSTVTFKKPLLPIRMCMDLVKVNPLPAAWILGIVAGGMGLGICAVVTMADQPASSTAETPALAGAARAGPVLQRSPSRRELESECQRLAQELQEFDGRLSERAIEYRRKLERDGLWQD